LDDYSNTTGELEDLTINKPVLLIAASQDYISRPEFVYQAAEQGKKEGYLPNAVVKQLDCGHWVQLEKPKELADMLVGFAESVEN
jgi:pimeloyl-ACP methyl ester carboxylesterase